MADMTQVFVLNMTYDFGLKQISLHYLLMFAFLLAPDARRLANVLVLNRSRRALVAAGSICDAARQSHARCVAQVAFGIYLIGMFTWVATRSYYARGGPGVPRSPLYGIWNVEELIGGRRGRPPVLNDYDRRWRRAIFDTPDVVVFQRTDDSFAHYEASDRHQPPRHRVDQAQRRRLARRVHVRTALVGPARARGDDGRLQAAASAAARGLRYVQAAEQPLPVGASAGSVRGMRSQRRDAEGTGTRRTIRSLTLVGEAD